MKSLFCHNPAFLFFLGSRQDCVLILRGKDVLVHRKARMNSEISMPTCSIDVTIRVYHHVVDLSDLVYFSDSSSWKLPRFEFMEVRQSYLEVIETGENSMVPTQLIIIIKFVVFGVLVHYYQKSIENCRLESREHKYASRGCFHLPISIFQSDCSNQLLPFLSLQGSGLQNKGINTSGKELNTAVLLSNSEWGPYPGCNLFFISFKKGIMKFIQTLLKTSITPQCLAFPLSWCVAILYCLIFIYLTIRIIRVEHY